MKERDIETLASLGANAVPLGTAALLRPWRMNAFITRAHEMFR